jgi:hypothetical protein
MGFYGVAFPSNASTFDLLQAVSPSCMHCSIVSFCHTLTSEFHGLPPDDRKRQDIVFSLPDARWYVTDKTNLGCHVNYVKVRRALI